MSSAPAQHPTACLALADGSIFYGRGFGATGTVAAELCFNTSMSGYQEIMTDPSYAGQIVTFTFPHIGNVGVNPEDDETADPVADGMVVKWDPTEPSNWRATETLGAWLARRGVRRIAATPAAERDLWEEDLTGPVAIVLGPEHEGLSSAWTEAADARVRVPMRGAADSLNVSVTGAHVLYEAVRQRRGAADAARRVATSR